MFRKNAPSNIGAASHLGKTYGELVRETVENPQMKTNTKGRKATSVRVPSWDPQVINSDLLKGLADDPMIQGIYGWAYGEIREFINKSFPMGHNPLETLRKILPQWQWSIHEVEVNVDPWEGEIGHPAYSAYCGYCGNGKGPKGSYGEEQVLCNWTHSDREGRVYHITAIRPVKDLGFVAKTKSGRWHFVCYRTEIHAEGGMNWQAYPPGTRWEKELAGKETRFVSFDGLIPEGTRSVPVEQVGETRDWEEGEGHPSEPGSWGKSGVEMDYRLPDGTVQTKRVCTGEWP